ncbi:hypothetical protein [Pseudovibrio brasiliensis]|uniref:Uncharacterized protein n=1 Tax=Pseudovibrio brasiliensis TaxID=1898042 RepID=A0ABX8ALL6_9HYPH|nr:hypothetical protein [Pseudovibrio brasiliensis]QUS55954.1 hypothetical protein KGB56_00240 [Pseudovibrio brasiliensis]
MRSIKKKRKKIYQYINDIVKVISGKDSHSKTQTNSLKNKLIKADSSLKTTQETLKSTRVKLKNTQESLKKLERT